MASQAVVAASRGAAVAAGGAQQVPGGQAAGAGPSRARTQERAHALDPVENISNFPVSGRPRARLKVRRDYLPGHYHQQYLTAAVRGDWGKEGTAGCGSSCLVRINGGVTEVRPVLCDRWACLLCGPRRAAWLKRQVQQEVETGRLDQFWTLTFKRDRDHDPTTDEITQAFHEIKAAWNRALTNLRKRFGRFDFVWIVEPTKVGWPHLHLLTSLAIDPSTLSGVWEKATRGSWVVDCVPVGSDRVSTYLTKYITKSATVRQFPEWADLKGTRIFSKSQGLEWEAFRSRAEPLQTVEVVTVDEDTGELHRDERPADAGEGWDRVAIPYWEYLRKAKGRGDLAAVQRDQGTPNAILVRGAPPDLSFSK